MSDEDDLGDDIDDDALDFDDEFEDFDSDKKKTLGDLWRDSPPVKIGIIVFGVLVLIFLFSVFGKKEPPPAESLVGGGSTLSAAPGTEEVSPAYVDAVIEENEARIEEAVREGTSALPTPIEPPIGRLTVPEEEETKEDPLQRWRRLQEERLERELQQAQMVTKSSAVDDVGLAANSETIQAMSEAMSGQMTAILERQNKEKKIMSISVTSPDYLESLFEQAQAENAEDGEDGSDILEPIVLIPAAEIEYAQLLIEANSDVPGPVLAQLVSGPLSGARMLGNFSVQEDLLTLNFTSAVKDGEVIAINAIALDPATTLPAMATDVDHRYFKRIVLPAAAAFIEGAAQAVSESGRTTITIAGDTTTSDTSESTDKQEIASGIEEVGQTLGEIFDEMGDVKTLVRIRSGTPMAVLFLSPVTIEAEPDDESAQ